MNADEVKAYVAEKYPAAMQSPVAIACSLFDATSTERVSLAVKHVQWLSKNRSMSYVDMFSAAIVRYALTDRESVALRAFFA